MSYKALYLTYRPQTFDEVAGQKAIVRTLKNALASGKMAHAYLFAGPRGTGKTTMAKLFAKALNCEEGLGHQCNACENCIAINEGVHPDVIEIDAASNNGVEEVRDLVEKVNYLPLKGKDKVYIIDEVHMMTTNAFNALLKTLEEPPADVVFILATTEPHKIHPTFISKCQRYDCTKVSDADIYDRMVEILDKEEIQYSKNAINAIISLADGGVRDALSILDQILAYSGDTLKEEDVYTLFGLTNIKEKVSFLEAIHNGDVTTCLKKINAFAEGGVDIKRLTSDLLELLKDVLVMKKTNDETELTMLDEENASRLAKIFDIHFLNEIIGAFLKAQVDYKTVNNIKTMFEVIILRLCTLNDDVKNGDVKTPEIKQVEEPKPIVVEPVKEVEKVTSTGKEVIKPGQNISETTKEDSVSKAPDWLFTNDNDKKIVEDTGDKYEFNDDFIIKLMVLGNKDERKDIVAKWGELSSYLGHPTLGDIVALIRDGRPFVVTKTVLILVYDFAKLADRLNIKTNQANVSEVISKMINREMFVYAVSRDESMRLIKAFGNLRQISKLPKANEIKIDLKEKKQDEYATNDNASSKNAKRTLKSSRSIEDEGI